MQRKARLNVCFICLACAVDRAGVTPLQSGTRFTRGRVEGSRDKRQDWVKKTGKGRCRRKRGVKAGETTDKCSKPCLSLHDFFFSPSHPHTFCSSSFVASHLSPFLPSALFLHMRHSHPSLSISLSLLCTLLCPTHTHARALAAFFSHAQPSLLACP